MLVDVVCLWQDVQECSTAGMAPPSRNDEENLRSENDEEMRVFHSGWCPYKAL